MKYVLKGATVILFAATAVSAEQAQHCPEIDPDVMCRLEQTAKLHGLMTGGPVDQSSEHTWCQDDEVQPTS